MAGCPIGGGPTPAAWSDYINGEVRLDQAPMQVLPYLRRSVAAGRRIDNRLIVGVTGLSAMSAEARVGDPAIALAQYGELIDHWRRDGAWNMQWATLRTLIELLTKVGRHADAAVLHGAMTASPSAPPVAGADATRISQAVDAMRQRLGTDRFAALHAGACARRSAVVVLADHPEDRPQGSVRSGSPPEDR
jgi:hypothetical protein